MGLLSSPLHAEFAECIAPSETHAAELQAVVAVVEAQLAEPAVEKAPATIARHRARIERHVELAVVAGLRVGAH
jgi:hypothetical protein